jgi:hypothetical protein
MLVLLMRGIDVESGGPHSLLVKKVLASIIPHRTEVNGEKCQNGLLRSWYEPGISRLQMYGFTIVLSRVYIFFFHRRRTRWLEKRMVERNQRVLVAFILIQLFIFGASVGLNNETENLKSIWKETRRYEVHFRRYSHSAEVTVHLVSLLTPCSSVNFYQTTRRPIPEDNTLQVKVVSSLNRSFIIDVFFEAQYDRELWRFMWTSCIVWFKT